MTTHKRRAKLGLAINVCLVALAFGLLGLVIWRNREKIQDLFRGYDLQLMSWGDGSGVPASGKDLVIVGIDDEGLLHIRIFDASGNKVTDTDETQLPATQAGSISTLKQQLPGVLPPHELTGAEKAQLVSEATSIVGQTPLDLRLLVLALAIYLTGLVSTFFRWFFLVRVIDPRFTLRAAILLGFIGNVFNLVIPGAVGGDLIKAAYLVRMHIKKTQAVASMVIDRIVGLLGLFILATIAGALAWPRASGGVAKLIVAAWMATGLGVLLLAVIFGQVITRIFPQLGTGHSRLSLIMSELKEMSTTYRRRLDVVSLCTLMAMGNHSLSVLAFYLVGWMLFPAMTTTLVDHFLMVPLTLFTTAVPLPFGALGVTEEVGDQLFKMVGHPSGALAMIGFRVLMYGSGLVGACVYLAKLKDVRSLTASAHNLEEELLDGDLNDDQEEPN